MNDIPREKLRYIIRQYGVLICEEPKRCEALLRDFCPEYKREINVLIGALKEKVAAELINNTSNTMPKEIIFARLVKRLHDNWGFAEEFCQWAVESWAVALGVISKPMPAAFQRSRFSLGNSTSEPQEKHKKPGFSEKPDFYSKTLKYQLRSHSITVSDDEFIKLFKLDEAWRPLQYIENDYQDNKNGTITDHATGLMWQKSGSDWLYLKSVPDYIYELNRKRFAGYNDWLLPTIEELVSLLEPEKQSNDLCINPIFDKKQRWCWSADKRASSGAWDVSFYSGRVTWLFNDKGCVRAVRP